MEGAHLILPTSLLVTGLVALSLACLLSIPSVLGIAKRISGRPPWSTFQRPAVYSDEDGEATETSSRRFPGRPQGVVTLVLSLFGFVASLGLAARNGVLERHDVVLVAQSGIWALIALQTAALLIDPFPTRRFQLAQYVAWTGVTASFLPVLEIVLAVFHNSPSPAEFPMLLVHAGQLLVAVVCVVLCATIPRRPDVYRNGRRVDRQSTVSVFSRLTLGWASEILQQVAKNPYLGLQDLPELPHAARSDTLLARLDQRRGKGPQPLWRLILTTHSRALVLQFVLGIVSALLSFGPQVALFGLLQSMEARQSDALPPAWLWVAAMGIFMILQMAVDAQLSWIIQSKIGIPIHSELIGLLFGKSMRSKNSAQSPSGEADGKKELKSGQRSVVNLAAVDARRISDFVASQHNIPASLIKLLAACVLLLGLIGLPSLLAGLAVAVLITPLNTFLTRRIGGFQARLMQATDRRITTLAECLQGIRQVKFSALEEKWQERISERRELELECLWAAMKCRVALISLWIFFPIIMSAVSLTVYSLIYGTLTASVAFTAISIFGNLDVAFAGLPDLLSKAIEASISAQRIQSFLDSAERRSHGPDVGIDISFRGATIAWPTSEGANPSSDRFRLTNLDLSFPLGRLSLITGRTGAGKSLLLTSILGDADIVCGTVNVPTPPTAADRHDQSAHPGNWVLDNALAYVSQNPWIENATVKANILLGLPYLESRYRQVLYASNLEKDLDTWPSKDETEIGAQGVNLSGGQKWRVAFARALYSRASVLVVDDIFSALDAHTSRHVFEYGLTGEVAEGRTRILATHHVGLCLPRAEYCVVLDQGRVLQAGTVEVLAKTNILSHFSQPPEAGKDETGNLTSNGRQSEDDVPSPRSAPLRFMQDEGRATGSNAWALYGRYLMSGNRVTPWAFAILAFTIYTFLFIGRSLWLSVWTGAENNERAWQYHSLLSSNSEFIAVPFRVQRPDVLVDHGHGTNAHLTWYIGVYVAISVATCLVGAARTMLLFRATLASSKGLFNDLLSTVLRAPMRWFDTVPQGRILNRFVADMSLLDTRLGFDLLFVMGRSFEMLAVASTAAFVCQPLLLPAIGFLALCIYLGSMYLAGAREVKRLESLAKSPIFEQFGSCLNGLATIRAFDLVDNYIWLMHEKVNDLSRTSWYLWLLNSWLTFRLTLLVAVISTATAAVVLQMGNISSSVAGLILSLVFRYSFTMVQAVQQYANLEMDMSAAERVGEYASMATEKQGGDAVPAAWPAEGRLEVEGLVAGYDSKLPPSLNDLSFTILPNQRVGIVGRTGAGKSSLALALFRFLEIRSGRIVIDGVDVSKIKLNDLRSRLAIIPQDPVLFSGTLRANMDPFDQHSDEELYEALASVSLVQSDVEGSIVLPAEHTGMFPSLSSAVSQGGQNLSQGQRQLICLARAVLSRPKILVMDEATSAMDMETDALIQKSLRSEFGGRSTLLVVAHRLSTVADFDRIAVLDGGKLIEFGSPRELMEMEGGSFRNLVENSGEREHLRQVIFGEVQEDATCLMN